MPHDRLLAQEKQKGSHLFHFSKAGVDVGKEVSSDARHQEWKKRLIEEVS